MKNHILFKTLIDILFMMQIPVVFAIIITIPTGIATGNQNGALIENWNYLYWSFFIFKILNSLLFLKGIFHLRKVARFLLSNKYFTAKIILNIRKCGILFSLVGVVNILLGIVIIINKILAGKLEISFESGGLSSLFLIIIGLFFIIQSKALMQAKGFKEENELTV